MVSEPTAVPEAPEPNFAVSIDERASSRISNQDGAWFNFRDWLGPFVLWDRRVKCRRVPARASTSCNWGTSERIGTLLGERVLRDGIK